MVEYYRVSATDLNFLVQRNLQYYIKVIISNLEWNSHVKGFFFNKLEYEKFWSTYLRISHILRSEKYLSNLSVALQHNHSRLYL